jgi:hypothetical protein
MNLSSLGEKEMYFGQRERIERFNLLPWFYDDSIEEFEGKTNMQL